MRRLKHAAIPGLSPHSEVRKHRMPSNTSWPSEYFALSRVPKRYNGWTPTLTPSNEKAKLGADAFVETSCRTNIGRSRVDGCDDCSETSKNSQEAESRYLRSNQAVRRLPNSVKEACNSLEPQFISYKQLPSVSAVECLYLCHGGRATSSPSAQRSNVAASLTSPLQSHIRSLLAQNDPCSSLPPFAHSKSLPEPAAQARTLWKLPNLSASSVIYTPVSMSLHDTLSA